MSVLVNHGVLTLVLLSLVILSICVTMLLLSYKYYEIPIILVLVSPFVHWLFVSPRHKSLEEILAVGQGTYLRLSILGLVGIAGMVVFYRLRRTSDEKLPLYMILFGLFVLYSIVSTIFSIDRLYTVVRSCEFLAFFCFLLGFYYWVSDRGRLDRVLRIYFGVVAVAVFTNVIGFLLIPEREWSLSLTGRFQGLFGHPNSMGSFCMVCYPALIWQYKRLHSTGKVLILSLFCMVLAMHIMSGSRGSLAASVFGFFVWLVILKRSAKLIVVVSVVVFSGFVLLQSKPASFKRERGTRITDLTGRPDLWRGCLQLIREKPLFGYGFGVEGKIWSDPRYFMYWENVLWAGSSRTSLHNAYLNLVIESGVLGLLCWLCFVLIPVRRLMSLGTSDYKAFFMVVISQALLIGVVESSISTSRDLSSLVFWFFWTTSGRLPFILSLESPEIQGEA